MLLPLRLELFKLIFSRLALAIQSALLYPLAADCDFEQWFELSFPVSVAAGPSLVFLVRVLLPSCYCYCCRGRGSGLIEELLEVAGLAEEPGFALTGKDCG